MRLCVVATLAVLLAALRADKEIKLENSINYIVSVAGIACMSPSLECVL